MSIATQLPTEKRVLEDKQDRRRYLAIDQRAPA